MDIQIISAILCVLFLIIPATKKTTLYIKIVLLFLSWLVLILNTDFSILSSFIVEFDKWLSIKLDENVEKVYMYLGIINCAIMLPFIIGYYLYRKNKVKE